MPHDSKAPISIDDGKIVISLKSVAFAFGIIFTSGVAWSAFRQSVATTSYVEERVESALGERKEVDKKILSELTDLSSRVDETRRENDGIRVRMNENLAASAANTVTSHIKDPDERVRAYRRAYTVALRNLNNELDAMEGLE